MSVLCPAGCGRKFVTQTFAEAHADREHEDWRTPKARGWATPYGFADFSNPVTYEEACAFMQRFVEGNADTRRSKAEKMSI